VKIQLMIMGRKDAPVAQEQILEVEKMLGEMDLENALQKSELPWYALWDLVLEEGASTSFVLAIKRQIEALVWQRLSVDVYVGAALKLADFKVFATDMDSTLINIECIDEMAEVMNKKERVAKITEDTMNGVIKNFEQSLLQRVGLLKGCSLQQLQKIYDDVLEPNLGAEVLMAACQDKGLKTLLISGGFSFFVDRLVDRLGFDYGIANQLDIKKGVMTGRLVGDIVDGKLKAFTVKNVAARMSAKKRQVIAMGDGSNDLDMFAQAGLSVGYHAKPLVKKVVGFNIVFGGLHTLLAVFEDTRAQYIEFEDQRPS
jgi:phosphoserine phosphatase